MKNTYKINKDRVKTGIRGLDSIINGGIPKNNIVLVSGAAGTGKTLFGLEYIYRGAREFNENGLYVSLEETPERLVQSAKNLCFLDIDDLIRAKKINIIKSEVYDLDTLTNKIEDSIEEINAKRVVIDSISVLSAFTENQLLVRRTILDISQMLREHDCTSVFTGTMKKVNDGSELGVTTEEYVADGVIALFHKLVGTSFQRSLAIIKMRETAHSEKLHPLKITCDGLIVLPSTDLTYTTNKRIDGDITQLKSQKIKDKQHSIEKDVVVPLPEV
ncbi:MAG: ATPase domain-containing protein [Candidatus Altiarchaeota archaeon]